MEHKCKKTDLNTVEKCELNANEIIKALECCTSEVTIEFNCTECPYIGKGCNIVVMRDALTLIKELTEEKEKLTINMNAYGLTAKRLGEENERLKADNKQLVNDNAELKNQIQDEIAEEDINLFDEFTKQLHEGIRDAKTDTVKKMKDELKKTFSALCKGEMGDLFRIIDQIAEEMLEGE